MAIIVQRATRLNTPGSFVIDWSNPICNRLTTAFAGDLSQNLVGFTKIASITGTKLIPGRSGIGRGFYSTYGVGTTDIVRTNTIPSKATPQQSIFVATHFNGYGGGGFGRMVDDNEDQYRLFVISPSTISFQRAYSTSSCYFEGKGGTPSVTTGAYNTFGVMISAALGYNAFSYLNGVLQPPASYTWFNIPAGAPTQGTAISFGNRPSDTARGFDGIIYCVYIWDRELSSFEFASLHANPWQLFL